MGLIGKLGRSKTIKVSKTWDLPHFSKKAGIRLQYKHKGLRVKRIEWPIDEWYKVLGFDGLYVIVEDPHGKRLVLDRDDMDTGWELI